jgi:hypothetical protein
MTNPRDAWRRWFGVLFLLLSFGMVAWGQTVLKPHLTGAGYISYWLLCFLFTFLALLMALVDLFIIRHRARKAHRDLIAKALQESKRGRPGPDEGDIVGPEP